MSKFIGRKKHSSNHSVTHETKCEMEDIHIKKYLSSLFSGTLTVLLLCCKCWIISVMITTVEKIWLNFSSIIHLKTSYVYVTVTLSHSFIFSFQKHGLILLCPVQEQPPQHLNLQCLGFRNCNWFPSFYIIKFIMVTFFCL